MYYSGIDLHKKTCFITTIDERGEVVKQAGLPNGEALILRYFFSLGTSHKAVVECTAHWYWISDLLADHEIELVLGHAKYLPLSADYQLQVRCLRDQIRLLEGQIKGLARAIVAKELARIVYHVLNEKTEFRSFKGALINKTAANTQLSTHNPQKLSPQQHLPVAYLAERRWRPYTFSGLGSPDSIWAHRLASQPQPTDQGRSSSAIRACQAWPPWA